MKMRKSFGPGEATASVILEPTGLNGRQCVALVLDMVTIRLPLTDAEQLGEALIKMVRRAEQTHAE